MSPQLLMTLQRFVHSESHSGGAGRHIVRLLPRHQEARTSQCVSSAVTAAEVEKAGGLFVSSSVLWLRWDTSPVHWPESAKGSPFARRGGRCTDV